MHDLLQGGVKPSRRNVFSSALGLPLNFVGSRQFAKSVPSSGVGVERTYILYVYEKICILCSPPPQKMFSKKV